MHASYSDILSRIQEKPSWYDSNGTPRYGEFSPDLCPDIYANEVILLEIDCQSCERKFLVEMHSGPRNSRSKGILRGAIKTIHYGDPPRHEAENCCAGDTMNCNDLRVLQFWQRDRADGWQRGA